MEGIYSRIILIVVFYFREDSCLFIMCKYIISFRCVRNVFICLLIFNVFREKFGKKEKIKGFLNIFNNIIKL